MSNWTNVASKVHSRALYGLVPDKYTFTPNREDVLESRFRMRYSSTCDSYYRDWADAVDPASPEVLPDWRRALKDWDSVCRVVDEQTGKVYLDKDTTSTTAYLKWSFDFGCCGLLVDQVTLRVVYEVTCGGELAVILTGDDGRKTVRYIEVGDYAIYSELENSAELDLCIQLTGDAGQVTRLFPQTIMGGIEYTLDLQVTLKPPVETLGRPRMLLGIMYSNAQAMQVDGRHFKKSSGSKSARGFLHIHLVKGRDLSVRGSQGSSAKCCFLRDAKKKIKCRTAAKKGSHPDWDEQFLIVGVTYHEMKVRALEVCIAIRSQNISGKDNNRVGGVRLSLGYKNVIAGQSQLIRKILERLTGSTSTESSTNTSHAELDTHASSRTTSSEDLRSLYQGSEEAVTTSGTPGTERLKMKRRIYRTTTRLSDLKVIVVEEEEDVEVDDITLESLQEALSEDPSLDGINGSLDVLNVVRMKEGMATSSQSPTRLRQSKDDAVKESVCCPSSVLGDTQEEAMKDDILVNGITYNLGGEFSAVSSNVDEDVKDGRDVNWTNDGDEKTLITAQMNCTEYARNGSDIFSDQYSDPGNSHFQACRTKTNGDPNNAHSNDKEQVPPLVVGNGKMHRGVNETGIKNGDKEQAQGHQEADAFQIQNSVQYTEDRYKDMRTAAVSSCRMDLMSPERVQDNVASGDELEQTLEKNRLLRKALFDAETNHQRESHSSTEDRMSDTLEDRSTVRPSTRRQVFCVRDLRKNLRLRKSNVSSTRKSSEKKRELERYLEANDNRQMLDSQGLEITQWLNAVKRPKQWHYCWHVLRNDMTYM